MVIAALLVAGCGCGADGPRKPVDADADADADADTDADADADSDPSPPSAIEGHWTGACTPGWWFDLVLDEGRGVVRGTGTLAYAAETGDTGAAEYAIVLDGSWVDPDVELRFGVVDYGTQIPWVLTGTVTGEVLSGLLGPIYGTLPPLPCTFGR